MSLAPFVRAMGRGPGRARHLTTEEAEEAMRLILAEEAPPEAVGALLMLMRYRGEIAEEIAGFVRAARGGLGAWAETAPGIDWPCYAAGRSRGLPWFLLSARLVADAGVPVLLHGWTANAGKMSDPRMSLAALTIGLAEDADTAAETLKRDRICFAPLEKMAPEILRVLRLREVLGLRSAINTVLRVLNPGGAPAAVQGVFHPSYRELQQDACALLGQPNMTVLKGGGGEFERHPGKSVAIFGLRKGAVFEETVPPVLDATRRLAEASDDPADIAALWSGRKSDPFAEAIVLGTAALALMTAGLAEDLEAATALAEDLWASRNLALAA